MFKGNGRWWGAEGEELGWGGWLFVGLSGKSSESRTFEQKRLERDLKKKNGRFNLGLYYRQAWKEVLARREIAK